MGRATIQIQTRRAPVTIHRRSHPDQRHAILIPCPLTVLTDSLRPKSRRTSSSNPPEPVVLPSSLQIAHHDPLELALSSFGSKDQLLRINFCPVLPIWSCAPHRVNSKSSSRIKKDLPDPFPVPSTAKELHLLMHSSEVFSSLLPSSQNVLVPKTKGISIPWCTPMP